MPAREPEQLHSLFEQAFNAGDMAALMALYEPDAALIPQPGVTVQGSAAIGDALRWFLDRGGQIALIRSSLFASATSPTCRIAGR